MIKIFLITGFLFINNYILCESIKYKYTDDNNEDANYYTLNYPKDCKKILDIKENENYEFIKKKGMRNIFTQCNIYVKGKTVKETVKAGSGAVVNTGVKLKDGMKSGTNNLADSVVKETEYFIDDTIKMKDSIIKGTGNIIGSTISKGSQVKDGVSSFLKGIFRSSD